MKKATPFTFYVLYYSAAAFLTPYLVLYFQQMGFNGAQIGLLVGIAPLLVLVGAPLWTWIADSTGSHRLVMSLAILVTIVGAILFPFFKTLIPVIAAVAVINLFAAPVNPMADSATMAMLAGEKEMYGRVRLGGTVGWGLAAPLAGMLIEARGLQWAFWGYAVLMLIGLLVSQGLIHPKFEGSKFFDRSILSLLANRRWTLFLALAFVCGMCFTATSNYLFPFLAELQATKPTMGLALTLASVSELPVLFFANRLIKWLKAYGLLLLGLFVTGLRLLLFAAFNSVPAVLIIQLLLQGLTFPAVWAAGVSYADENAPAGLHATAQGLFGAVVFGFGAATGGFTGGLLLESLGGRSMYLLFGTFALASLAIIASIERHVPSKAYG
jgi:PPP family 3-phenylpropionic acid transporter